ncbi:MAG: hypothetical protein GC151_12675 [Betaproteobacteria bacterium]|nr:hypothetical protein [Betaproteobacteria bacterium]
MRLLRILLGVVLLAVPVSIVCALWLALDRSPRLERTVVLTPEHVARAKAVLTGSYRSTTRHGDLGTITIRPDDADLAANYLVNRFAHGSASVTLEGGAAHVVATVPLRFGSFVRYLNVDAYAMERPGLPAIGALRVGQLPIPDSLARYAERRALQWLDSNPDYRVGLDAVRRVRFFRWGLVTVYEWQPGLSARVRASAFDAAERARLHAYQDALAGIVAEMPARVSVADLLPRLFTRVRARSTPDTAVAENRSALLVATMYVIRKPMYVLVPEARTWYRAPPRLVTLSGRDDFPKHFLVSATLAAYAGTVVSDAVGLYKELEDARRGSGFSFNDIAADRAGTRFGEYAVRPGGASAAFQVRVSAGLHESAIMPDASDLPEFMPETEFRRRYGGVGAPAYRRMMAEIERRVDALSFYR